MTAPEDSQLPDAVAVIEEVHIGEALETILKSVPFCSSNQYKSLLRYLVENSISGREGMLKERVIGAEVFGRKPDYNTGDDPIVRTRVGELRRRLAQYYQNDESRGYDIHFFIPSGSYRVHFKYLAKGHSAQLESDAPIGVVDPDLEKSNQITAPVKPSEYPQSSSRLPTVWITIAACLALSTAFLLIEVVVMSHKPPPSTLKLQKSELDLFWEPVLYTNKTVLICNSTVMAFTPSQNYLRKTQTPSRPSNPEKPASYVQVPPLTQGQVLTSKDLKALPNGYMTPGGLSTTVSVINLLLRWHRNYDLREAANLPFVDLQASPAVLIGSYSNYWVMDLDRDLPFFFDSGGSIRERGGQHRVWSTPRGPDEKATDDYAIVSRLLDSKTRFPVIILAGRKSCGTEAAGEFATETDPMQLKLLRTLSRDVLEKNSLELVLHVSLDDCKPTSINIVALKTW